MEIRWSVITLTTKIEFHPSLWSCGKEEIIVYVSQSIRDSEFQSAEQFLSEHNWMIRGNRNGQHIEDIQGLMPLVEQHIRLVTTADKLSGIESRSSMPPIQPGDDTSMKVWKYAEWFLKNYHFYAASERSQLWRFHEDLGIWRPDGTNLVQKVLTALQDCEFKTHMINEVLSYVRYQSYDERVTFGGSSTRLVVKNGTLDIASRELSKSYSADEYQIIRIPVDYDPSADCPNFKQFLREVIPDGEDRRAVEEFFGYCLLKEYTFEIIMLFVGSGANGKSVLLAVLKRFLGPENVSSVTPQQLDNSRFSSAQLHGKLANIAGDIPARPLKNTGTIKMMTGGDLIHAEHKHRDPFDFVNHAKLIFSANQVPETWDTSEAFYRRFRIIEFPNKFSPAGGKFVPRNDLLTQLTSESELSGILNLALDGLKRLLSQGCLSGEPTEQERRMDYIRRSDPAQYFFERFLSQDVKAPQIEKRDLYGCYVRFTHSLGETPVSEEWFAKKLRRLIPYASESRPREGDRRITVWDGVAFDRNSFEGEVGHWNKTETEDPDQTSLQAEEGS